MATVTRLLLLGGSGQLGQALQTLAWDTELQAPASTELPLAQPKALADYLAAYQPDLIINAAAFTQVDAAEQAQQLNWRLNADLPAQLAAYASAHQCRLVHFSSDYVFDGSGDLAWSEQAKTAPLNEYGRAKAAGDAAVLAFSNSLLLRTSWLYAARGHNFMRTILKLAAERTELSVVADQIGAPTPAWWLAAVTQHLLVANERGLYHASCSGAVSWQQFACAIVQLAHQAGLPVQLQLEHIHAIASDAYPQAARRPYNSRLDVSKLTAVMGEAPPDWQQALQLTFAQYLRDEARR